MKKLFLNLFLISVSWSVFSQDAVNYQTPPQAIKDLLLAKPTPGVNINSKAEWMLLSERNSFPSVEELAMPEYRIAGMRINPNNYAPSRLTFINNFTLNNIKSGVNYQITGLPAPLYAYTAVWSPNEDKIAIIHVSQKTNDLYVIDIATRKATKFNKQPLNLIMGGSVMWADNNTLIYKVAIRPATAAPAKPLMPK
ncbi:MAG: S9 family peptidase, partial [Pedobacter sp.]